MYDPNKMTGEQMLSQLMDGEWHDLKPSECVAAMCKDEALRSKWARYHFIRDSLKNEPVQADQALVSRICSAIADEPSYTNITPFNATQSSAMPRSKIGADSESAKFTQEKAIVQAIPAAAAVSVDVVDTPSEASLPVAERQSWVKTGIAGFALAASVALVTVVGVDVFQRQNVPQVSTLASIDATSEIGVANTTQSFAPLLVGGGSGAQAGTAPDTFVASASTTLPVVEFVANTGSYWMSPDSSTRIANESRLNMMLSHHIEHSPTAGREGLLPYSRLVGYEEIQQGQ